MLVSGGGNVGSGASDPRCRRGSSYGRSLMVAWEFAEICGRACTRPGIYAS